MAGRQKLHPAAIGGWLLIKILDIQLETEYSWDDIKVPGRGWK